MAFLNIQKEVYCYTEMGKISLCVIFSTDSTYIHGFYRSDKNTQQHCIIKN